MTFEHATFILLKSFTFCTIILDKHIRSKYASPLLFFEKEDAPGLVD
jgi:hypothetical protein